MLLDVQNLTIAFRSRHASVEVVRGVSFSLEKGRTLAIVGESGSGKSVTSMSLAGLLPPPPQCFVSGMAYLNGEDLFSLSEGGLQKVRGKRIAYVFQEPSSALNPYYAVGRQILEAIRLRRSDVDDERGEVIRLLGKVGIRSPEERFDSYPHQLSGGQKQRIVIAMALACRPDVLVADEPTTALDVTIEAQIMELLAALRRDEGMSIILITHNFGIVDGFADEVAVMYRGKIVEQGETAQVLAAPKHAYTRSLIRCIPRIGSSQARLPVIDHAEIEAEEAANHG